MRPSRPLPVELRNRVFTRAELIGQGFSDSRLAATDVQRLGRGLYRLRDSDALEQGGWTRAGVGDLESIQAVSSSSWFSYSTACSLYQVPVAQHDLSGTLHISVLRQVTSLSRHPGVTLHRPEKVFEGEIRRLNRLRVSSPERVFLEMAGLMKKSGLVALGDQLVRVPRLRFEGRSQPWTTPNKLWRCLDQHPSTVGIRKARAAAQLVRIGADSVPETLLRLRISEAGLPEPQLQWHLDPSNPTSPVADMAYPAQKVALQYEGAHHFTPEQQAADQVRNSRFLQAGWNLLLINRVDLRQGFRGAISRLAEALLNGK